MSEQDDVCKTEMDVGAEDVHVSSVAAAVLESDLASSRSASTSQVVPVVCQSTHLSTPPEYPTTLTTAAQDPSERDKAPDCGGATVTADRTDPPTLTATAQIVSEARRPSRRISISKDVLVQAALAAAQAPASSEFYLTFGFLGVPMVVAFAFSALTLFYMAVAQVFPTQVANFLMNTDHLDNGDYWLLVDPPTPLVVISTLMLLGFGCCYVALALYMLFFREYALRHAKDQEQEAKTVPAVAPSTRRALQHTETRDSTTDRTKKRLGSLARLRALAGQQRPTAAWGDRFRSRLGSLHSIGQHPTTQPSSSFLHKFVHEDGIYHAYYNALMDLPKLIFQTTALSIYLEEGFPLPLTYFYLAMLMTNWLISFYRFQRYTADRDLIITRLFYLFDLFFAVFAPIVVLAYAYVQFDMDRTDFDIRESTLSPGSYDRIARLFADPVQIDIFRYGFMHLQLTKVWYVVAKTCLNALVVYKWKKIITFLVIQRRIQKVFALHRKNSNVTPKEGANRNAPRPKKSIVHSVIKAHRNRRHLLLGIAVFLACMVAIITYVVMSISTSTKNCRHISECRVFAYHWGAGAGNSDCPCLVFSDRDQAPRTWYDWINATDVTQSLAVAAKSGHLKTIQIINRVVPELPSELSRCVEMEQMILIYTRTESLPDWVGSFHGLRYIHIESNFVHYPLKKLPLNMFAHMSKLRFIRFGGAATLPEFPSLAGLEALTTLVLSIPRGLQMFPDFDDLTSLSTLIIADATHATKLPSLQPLKNLKTFSLFRRNAMCCNGFVTGTCDLMDYQCKPRANELPVVCEAARMPEEDHQLLANIHGFVCTKNLTSDVVDSEPTELSTDRLCGGVLYRQCHLNGRNGICYNGRMQVIHCDVFGEYKAMRELEIKRGIGAQCDPQEEAWLGCTV